MIGREPRVQLPVLDSYSDMPLFNTKAVVHQTGVPAPTLRAWERRYGILAPRRGENDYRLYSERDMMMVAWLRERVESGMTISQAIALLRSLEPARRRGRRSRVTSATLLDTPQPPAAPERLSLDDLSIALLHQCAHLDEFSASRTVAQALAVYSVEDVCLSLFTPALVEIGRMWAEGEMSIIVEHFASALIRAQLESLFRSAAANERGSLVVVGCAPGELHELGSLMLALFLRRSGLRVVYLGQNIEIDSLIMTINTLKPSCVLLSAALRPHAETLALVGQRLSTIGVSQTLFCFGGQAFLNEPDLARDVPGVFLGTDAREAVEQLKKKLSA